MGSMETANDGKYQLVYMNVCWTAQFACTRVSWRRVRLDVEVKYCMVTKLHRQCCFRINARNNNGMPLNIIVAFNCPEWLPKIMFTIYN